MLYLLLLVVSSLQTECNFDLEGYHYDISQLSQNQDYSVDINRIVKDSVLQFNFCKPSLKQCTENSYANIFSKDKCQPLTKLKMKPSLLNSANPLEGIKIDFDQANQKDYENQFNIEFILECDAGSSDLLIQNINMENNLFTLKAQTRYACPIILEQYILNQIRDYKYFIAPLCLIVGIILCFLGSKYKQQSMFPMGFLIGFFISLIIVFQYFTEYTQGDAFYYLLGICLVIGIFMGIFLAVIKKFGVIIFNCSFGFGISLIIYNNFTRHIKTDPECLSYWITIGSCIFMFFILSLILYDFLTIITTSIIGSLLIVMSVSLLMNQSQWIQIMINLAKNNDIHKINNIDIIYISVFGVLSIISIMMQSYMTKKKIVKNKKRKVKRDINDDGL